MPRVYVPWPIEPGESITVDDAEARHLVQVLRRGGGDPVQVSGPGGLFAAVVERVLEGAAPRIELLIGARLPTAPAVPWMIAVAQVKGHGFELAVRQVSELGLAALTPLVCERSVVRGVTPAKLERWRRIAREAAKQSGRTPPLEVGAEASFSEILRVAPSATRYIATPGGHWPGLEALGRATAVAGADSSPAVIFLIGPEGGFSPLELSLAEQAGFVPFGFPTPVLRTGTAVAFVAALGGASAPPDSPPECR